MCPIFLFILDYELSRTVKGLRFHSTFKIVYHSFIESSGRHKTPDLEKRISVSTDQQAA